MAEARALSTIAEEIEDNWSKQGKGVNYAARPFLDVMLSLNSINDKYFADDAKSIVLYFLANAGSWRGEVAKRVKAELKAITK